MKIKKLTASLLALVLVLSVFSLTASALSIDTRRAGVSQDYSNGTGSYASYKIKSSNGLLATEPGGYIVYKLNDDISSAFLSVTDGQDSLDYKVYTSTDGINYQLALCNKTSKGFVMNGKSQTLFEYKSFSGAQKYFKIEFLNTNVSINGVYINLDAQYTPYADIYDLAFKDNSAASESTGLMADFSNYKEKIKNGLFSTVNVTALLDSMNNDGSWSNITYDGANTSSAYTHCDRIKNILMAISTVGNKHYKDEAAIAKVGRAIDYWIAKNIDFTNWYYDAITVPQYIGQALLVSNEVLPGSIQQKLANYMKDRVRIIDGIAARDAGSNILNEMKAKIYYALYTNDLEMLLDCFDRINLEIIIVDDMPEEQAWRNDSWRSSVPLEYLPPTMPGIQADYSSLFHGPLIYSGLYGQELIDLVATMLVDTDGTKLFPQTGLQVLADHILEHYAYVTRGDTICYSTKGRHLSVTGLNWDNTSIIESTKTLLQLKDIPRRNELQAFVDAADMGSVTDYLKADYPAVDVQASAEPQAENNAANAIDGNLDTRWSANNDGDYIITDLGDVKKVGTIGICFHMGASRRTKFELHVSTDNANWIQVCKGEGSGSITGYEYFVFDPMDVRYIRLTGHGNSVNAWNSINEISAFEGIPTEGAGKYGETYTLVDEIGNTKRYEVKAPEPVPKAAITGHRHFWKADFTGHAKEDYLFTIRAASRRSIGGEAGLGNNMRGHFMGDGATFIYRTCREYDDIFAAWDWHKAPGTTVETKPFDEVEAPGNRYHSSESYRVNGVSDGNNGATAMELIHGGLSAKKAWFMFDDEVVALGADITLKGGKYSAISTVNQSLLKTDAVIGKLDGKTSVINAKSDETQTPLWAIQDGIGYVFDGKSKVHITAKEQSGDRYDIDWNYATTRPNKTNIVTRDVFTLWFDHTVDKTSTYEYTIVPNVTQDELKEYASAKPVRVNSNTGKLQSVEHTVTGEKQAIFWTPGLANFEGISVECDKEVIIAISGLGEEQRLAISSLSQKAEKVTLVVTRDGVESEYVLDLPSERYAGSSLILNLNTGAIEK